MNSKPVSIGPSCTHSQSTILEAEEDDAFITLQLQNSLGELQVSLNKIREAYQNSYVHKSELAMCEVFQHLNVRGEVQHFLQLWHGEFLPVVQPFLRQFLGSENVEEVLDLAYDQKSLHHADRSSDSGDESTNSEYSASVYSQVDQSEDWRISPSRVGSMIDMFNGLRKELVVSDNDVNDDAVGSDKIWHLERCKAFEKQLLKLRALGKTKYIETRFQMYLSIIMSTSLKFISL